MAIVQKGCVLEFDLEYPKKLCQLHNDCPLAPDKLEIKERMLLWQKKKYVLHYCGSTLSDVKTKKIVEFSQSQ